MSGVVTAGLVKAGFDLVDNLFTSDEEKAQAKQKLMAMEQKGELKKISESAGVVKAEANSDSFLTSNWRPITMLVFVVIIANNFILAPYVDLFFSTDVRLEIPPDMWQLLKVGLGGYVVSRGGEKMVREHAKGKQKKSSK